MNFSKNGEHQHRWTFLTAKTAFEPSIHSQSDVMYELIEYAYLVCHGCQKVVKRPVKTEEGASA
jgi:hypothetical protein